MTNILFFASVRRNEYYSSSSGSSESHSANDVVDELEEGNLKNSRSVVRIFGSKGPLACIRSVSVKPMRKINLCNNHRSNGLRSRKEEFAGHTYRIVRQKKLAKNEQGEKMTEEDELSAHTKDEEFSFWNKDPSQIKEEFSFWNKHPCQIEEEFSFWKEDPCKIDACYVHPFRRLVDQLQL